MTLVEAMHAKWSRLAPVAFGLAALLAATVPPATAQQADADAAAKRLYMTKTCLACHGRDGRKAIGDYPEIAGQKADYIIAQMKDILDGKRTGSADASGNPRAKGMRGALIDPNGNRRITDDEIVQIANWLSKLEPKPAEPLAEPLAGERKAKAEKIYSETCEACHGKTGREPQEGFPAIAGQKRSYVLIQMKDIKSKARSNGQSEAMGIAIAELKDDELELVSDYVSSLAAGKP